MPRLFIGIPITNSEHINNIQENLQKLLCKSNIKWVEPKNFHITLKFLGDTDSHVILPLCQVLEHLSKKFDKFRLNSKGLGIFGPSKKPHTIYYGFQKNSILTSMQQSIEDSLSELGFETGEKGFTSHMTIGRVKSLVEKENLFQELQTNDENSYTCDVREFQLIKSVLTQKGSIYSLIRSFRLK